MFALLLLAQLNRKISLLVEKVNVYITLLLAVRIRIFFYLVSHNTYISMSSVDV